MVADHFTKTLQGQQFTKFRDIIMGIVNEMSEELVGGRIGTEHATTHPGINGIENSNKEKQTNIAKANIISDNGR